MDNILLLFFLVCWSVAIFHFSEGGVHMQLPNELIYANIMKMACKLTEISVKTAENKANRRKKNMSFDLKYKCCTNLSQNWMKIY